MIAFNGGHGVLVDAGAEPTNGDAILRNAISDNGLLGIALLSGANDAMPPPVITAVTTNANATTITGTLEGPAAKLPFRVEAFVSPACDGSGFGEGKRFLAAKAITTNPAGGGTFSIKVGPLAAGQVVTVTATRASGPQDTFAFSACFPT